MGSLSVTRIPEMCVPSTGPTLSHHAIETGHMSLAMAPIKSMFCCAMQDSFVLQRTVTYSNGLRKVAS